MTLPANPYRILVTGSRDWTDIWRVSLAISDAIDESGSPPSGVVIVHGACPHGADELAHQIASGYGWRTEPHPADWNRHGKAAGFRRNAEMVAAGADICLAFIRDGSRGATHCAGLAEKAGIPVRRYEVTTP